MQVLLGSDVSHVSGGIINGYDDEHPEPWGGDGLRDLMRDFDFSSPEEGDATHEPLTTGQQIAFAAGLVALGITTAPVAATVAAGVAITWSAAMVLGLISRTAGDMP